MPPYEYDIYNIYNASISPSTVHTQNSALAFYFRRYLLQRAMSVFKWTFPDDWKTPAINHFLFSLYCIGYVSIINTDKFGIIPQWCSITGFDVFYQPTHANISNPLISQTLQPRIGTQCALIKLQPDYGGIMDIVAYYADQLALLSESVGVNAINSHLSFAFGADNKSAAESFKKMYDNFAKGDPAVFYDKSLRDPKTGELSIDFINNDVKNSYIISDLLCDIRAVMNQFDTDVGIANANVTKRERLISDEIQANNTETRSLCELWLDTINNDCDVAHELFGITISADWRDSMPTVDSAAQTDDTNDDSGVM